MVCSHLLLPTRPPHPSLITHSNPFTSPFHLAPPLSHSYSQAIWFTEEAGSEGPVFGNVDTWKGLGVMLDSFDNDALVGGHEVIFTSPPK